MSWRGMTTAARRSMWPRERSATGVGGAAIALAVTLAACASSSGTPATTTAVIPPGWNTYSFAEAAIAVPRSWDVSHGGSCISWSVPGMLALESSGTAAESSCPRNFLLPTVVSVSAYHPGSTTSTSAPGQKQVVNGIPVYAERVLPGDGVGDGVVWTVPSLGVVVYADGDSSSFSPVIHTLHRA